MSRATGRTTRIIDHAIQVFFEHGELKVFVAEPSSNKDRASVSDHHESKNANYDLFNRIVNRLYREHGGPDRFEINKHNFYIKLKF